MATDERLRREIDELGRNLGDTVRRFAGDGAFALVERVRGLARRFCSGEHAAADELDALLRDQSPDQLRLLIRAFGNFLELANLAEDRQRIRALRDREREQFPEPRRESIQAAVRLLKERGFKVEEIAELLTRVSVELVFTAHPTEAKRKSLRAKLRRLRKLLTKLDTDDLTQREERGLRDLIRREVVKMWQTDVIRSSRPTVLEEVQRGLSFNPVLWEAVPEMIGEVRQAIAEEFPGEPIKVPALLTFGSWMGGDRDGHPYVTPEITRQTLVWLRAAAIERHQAICEDLVMSLSLSVRQTPACARLFEPIAAACAEWPEAAERIEAIPSIESVRRWLRVISWRLEQTRAGIDVSIDESSASEWAGEAEDLPGAYVLAEELADDVRLIRNAFAESGNQEIIDTEVQPWLDQIATFGLHTARLDVRQHSEVYEGVMDELWAAMGLIKEGEKLSEERRCELLVETLPIAANIAPVDLSDTAHETLRLFRVLRRTARRFGGACLGGHVISMTRNASDLLTVLWLWTWSERVDGGRPEDEELFLPVVPLFETINDLTNAPRILGDALKVEAYREHVAACDERQIVMIGYSDSTKDGGYLAATWALQSVQIQLHELAEKEGINLTFFHGRGGSLGRGGGPAARSILSLPPETFDGSLRLTEQGEVLAERYDDPSIAHRHLEQVIWAVLIASTTKPAEPTGEWRKQMQRMSDASYAAYRELVEHEGFTQFFRTATPISQIENLPIGSRPAKRKKGGRIEDLRAIPWVFSWTQSRCLLPAWYGLGAGLNVLLDESGGPELLRKMYVEWPFFRAAIANAALALAKSNRPVFHRYAQLSGEDSDMRDISRMLDEEYERATAAVLKVTDREELLDDIPWLKESIKVRNRYVDPLNLIQLEVLRRVNEATSGGEPVSEDLRHLSQLTIKGLAAGMRTTG